MRIVVQRITSAEVVVENESTGKISGTGLLCLVGFGHNDSEDLLATAINKIINLRIFSNDQGRFDNSLLDLEGELFLVPQFTLYADTSKGRRPEFFGAMAPELASPLFDKLVEKAKDALGTSKVKAGIFGADMKVNLVNDGPVTIILEV